MGYRQGDPAWRAAEIAPSVNNRRYNLGRVGCVVTSIAEAARRNGIDCDPAELLRRGRAAKAFIGPNTIIPKLAECAGLSASKERRVSGGIDALRAALEAANGFALLHVARIATPGATPGPGVHFVLAVSLDADTVTYADPATGHDHEFSFITLEGPAGWRVDKGPIFRVVSVAPLSRANVTEPTRG